MKNDWHPQAKVDLNLKENSRITNKVAGKLLEWRKTTGLSPYLGRCGACMKRLLAFEKTTGGVYQYRCLECGEITVIKNEVIGRGLLGV